MGMRSSDLVKSVTMTMHYRPVRKILSNRIVNNTLQPFCVDILLSYPKKQLFNRVEKKQVVLFSQRLGDANIKMSRFDDEKFKQLQLKVKFNAIPKTRLKKFNQLFNGYKNGLVCGDPGKFVMTPFYGSYAEKLYQLQPRSDDVWILTFPKCGKYLSYYIEIH